MEDYTPEGTTGNGRCNGGECGMGTVNPDTGKVNGKPQGNNRKRSKRWIHWSRGHNCKDEKCNAVNVDGGIPDSSEGKEQSQSGNRPVCRMAESANSV